MADESKSTGDPPGDQQRSAERATDARSADFALICSQAAEVRPLLKHLDRQRKYVDNGFVFRGGFLDQTLRIVVVEAGFDFAGHRKATQIVINEHHPNWVMSTGFSLGLSDTVKTGDVCLANQISDLHGHSLQLDLPLEGGKRVHCGKHVVMDEPSLLPAAQQQLSDSSGADAADLASLAVAQVCQQKTGDQMAASFLAIRSGLSRRDADVTELLLEVAFCRPKEVTKPPVMQWLAKLKPDPVRREALKRLEEASVNSNRYLLQVIRKLGEKLSGSRW
ncbi:MAG: hypothetical protein ABJZ55_10025 [Fuerstiella sp.]